MCTVKSQTQIMVCDVSRNAVKQSVNHRLEGITTFETVHGEGTLVTCLDSSRIAEFQKSVSEALGWVEEEWLIPLAN